MTEAGKMSLKRADGETKAIVSPFLRVEGIIPVVILSWLGLISGWGSEEFS